MMALFHKKWFKSLAILLFLIAISYGMGRVYYRFTHGFSTGNIVCELTYDSARNTRPLSNQEMAEISSILDQKFYYLGKGCQAYVFNSEDDKYVIKFFKYQRYRIQPWFNIFSFIPAVNDIRLAKLEKKQQKLNSFLQSWKIAFDELQPETGLIYVHLNKTDHLNKILTIYDKMGFEHQIDLDQTEFLVQKKAQVLCSYIEQLRDNNQLADAVTFIDKLIDLIRSEYSRGFADNDHAIMQNTGVIDGKPINIDVGQFVKNEMFMDPETFKQELFNKTYKFHKWLEKAYPELAIVLENRVRDVVGERYATMQPYFKPHD